MLLYFIFSSSILLAHNFLLIIHEFSQNYIRYLTIWCRRRIIICTIRYKILHILQLYICMRINILPSDLPMMDTTYLSLSVLSLSVFCCSDTNWWYQYYSIQPGAPGNFYTYPDNNKPVPGRGKGNSNRRWCCTEVDCCWDVNFSREFVFMNSTWPWIIAGTQKVLAALLGKDGDVKGWGYHEVFTFLSALLYSWS